MRLIAFALSSFLLAALAHAASFDCAKARTKVEHVICDDPELSGLDDDMNAAYQAIRKKSDNIQETIGEQRKWINERNGCLTLACIKSAYIAQLRVYRIALMGSHGTGVVGARHLPPTPHYILAMSVDDSVCIPILEEYNRNISLDLWPKPFPVPYPWPAPKNLAVKWNALHWGVLKEDQLVSANTYTMSEADLNDDGIKEGVVRRADWMRSDYRFTSLTIFPHDSVLPKSMGTYAEFVRQHAIAELVPGVYNFSKLKGRELSADLNDFDVIKFNDKFFVTAKAVDMEGIVEVHKAPQWRIIGRVRYRKPPNPPKGKLDVLLDGICYFQLKLK